ncbi:Host cell surface-exposed lipoprotein [Streptococcus infantarius subsp. infantarius]|nr:Host cell surface-exposed lipoprotein [Streptococcus infantarius subsp. infantarius]MCO4616275.1 Host cell surface-exposed lipoprotein [Streptococcus infantarius subsp. infantarius]
MKKKTVFMLGTTAILSVAILGVVDVPTFNEPTMVYAATKTTTTQKEALKKAKDYCQYDYLSKKKLYHQLTDWDGYSEEDAQYAVDHLKANYKKAALKQAKSYYKNMHMSKQGIYDQLSSEMGEKFTPEEAQYAIDNSNFDYNKAALKQAKSYQKNMAMSPDAIYDQLISENGEKFTEQEAQYAIDNLNK